jgi:NAD(P)-dependent dehydrogenase (short-subunit alcohol dehydrogenase family)
LTSNSLAGKACLVTGGASGIGKATAMKLAAAGAQVLIADKNESRTHAFVRMDVTDPSDVYRVVQATVHRYGRLDCAVNCAGVEDASSPTAQIPDELWSDVLAVNLTGVFTCMREELTVMEDQNSGVIVNVASVAGVRGFANHAAYAASKHGVVGLTRTAALEYARSGIRINAVCPGFTRTPMVERYLNAKPDLEAKLEASMPMGRFAAPEEIADTILYLCSDAASFITGQAIVIDGGLTAR